MTTSGGGGSGSHASGFFKKGNFSWKKMRTNQKACMKMPQRNP